MEKNKKMMSAIACFAVVCIILTCGCTTQSATTESTGSSVVPSSSEEITVDTPVEPPAEMPVDEAGTGASPQGSMPPGDLSEMTKGEIQDMLDMMQENGIDTTEAEEALENGDMDAVFAFMEENRPADGGPGTQPDGPPPR